MWLGLHGARFHHGFCRGRVSLSCGLGRYGARFHHGFYRVKVSLSCGLGRYGARFHHGFYRVKVSLSCALVGTVLAFSQIFALSRSAIEFLAFFPFEVLLCVCQCNVILLGISFSYRLTLAHSVQTLKATIVKIDSHLTMNSVTTLMTSHTTEGDHC
jgi:hypothetical protein